MIEYKPSFIKNNKNLILLILIFTVVLGFRLYYDYNKLQPVVLPVLKNDMQENIRITDKDITTRVFWKINLADDIVVNNDDLIGKYTNSLVIAGHPISSKQIISSRNKFRYLADLPKNKRVIPLPSDINSTGIEVGDRIEITATIQEDDHYRNVTLADLSIVLEKIDARGDMASQSSSEDNKKTNFVPKVLMVEVFEDEAKEIENTINGNGKLNVRLVPPSVFEGGKI